MRVGENFTIYYKFCLLFVPFRLSIPFSPWSLTACSFSLCDSLSSLSLSLSLFSYSNSGLLFLSGHLGDCVASNHEWMKLATFILTAIVLAVLVLKVAHRCKFHHYWQTDGLKAWYLYKIDSQQISIHIYKKNNLYLPTLPYLLLIFLIQAWGGAPPTR